MKIAAEIPVHYGADYLRYAVEAVEPFVDKVIILYTDKPSFGHASPTACPETEEQLRACCDGIHPDKLVWHKGKWFNEGAHRGAMAALAPDCDLIVRADADEVWDHRALMHAIGVAEKSSAHNFLCGGFRHFYRSFGYACADVWQPVRVLNMKGSGNAVIDFEGMSIAHFGYAIRPELMRYKWSAHGHQSELRPGWLENVWMKNVRENCHPTMPNNWWTAAPFDREQLPSILRAHPFYELNVIE